MTVNRREFLWGVGTIPFLGIGENDFAKLKSLVAERQNIYLLFNDLRDIEYGELKEYTTIRYVQSFLTQLGVQKGAKIIATGLRSGTTDDPYGMPGELALYWEFGTPWNGMVTDPTDAHPIPLGIDDPVVTTMLAVLYDDTAQHLSIDDPSKIGTVLWTMHEDETVRTSGLASGHGMHNSFNDVDGGLVNDLFDASVAALNGESPDRDTMASHFPNFTDDKIWNNFSATLGKTVIETEWLAYIRKQGWPGAGLVVTGSHMNVTQFHFREVKNRISRSQPDFTIGNGTHPPLRVRYGREVRPFLEPGIATWTMVGYLWDLEHPTMAAQMKQWQKRSDVFGHTFHLHGFRNDGTRMGHTLFTQVGSGKVDVAFYPMTYTQDKTAFFFNNDLCLQPESMRQDSAGLRIQVANAGGNFSKEIEVALAYEDGRQSETKTISLLKPYETTWVTFDGEIGKSAGTRRTVEIDPNPDFYEGGANRANNKILLHSDLGFEWMPDDK